MVFSNFLKRNINQRESLTKGKKLLSYYVVDNAPLEMEFNIKSCFDMELMEARLI
jgi:hypothetical protein